MLPTRKEFKWNKKSKELIDHVSNRDVIYETSSGKTILIKNMDTNHVKNSLKKIERDDGYRQSAKDILKLELIYRQIYNLK